MFDQMRKSATCYSSPGRKMGGEKKTVQCLVGLLSSSSFGFGGIGFWFFGILFG